MKTIKIIQPTTCIKGDITLSGSKSESNRVLIIKAMAGNGVKISNASNARDSQTLIKLLASEEEVLDVIDAGAPIRFLTAYCALKNKAVTLTGTPRLCERPIGVLVNALRTLGADIKYLGKEGFPPLKMQGFNYSGIGRIEVDGNISSQFISALLMVAPLLPDGLSVSFKGEVRSKPYIQMTLKVMEHFGVRHKWVGSVIEIPHGQYAPKEYTIEGDWSSASYLYSIAALSPNSELHIKGLNNYSTQGDSLISEMMKRFSVHTRFVEDGVVLVNKHTSNLVYFEQDFSHCPDLAQTVAVLCAAKGVKAKLTGLASLRIKETDRIEALKTELTKLGVEVTVEEDTISLEGRATDFSRPVCTYDDHRMALSFAPLALLGTITIENPDVVVKSYPDFWEDMKKLGFGLQTQTPQEA